MWIKLPLVMFVISPFLISLFLLRFLLAHKLFQVSEAEDLTVSLFFFFFFFLSHNSLFPNKKKDEEDISESSSSRKSNRLSGYFFSFLYFLPRFSHCLPSFVEWGPCLSTPDKRKS